MVGRVRRSALFGVWAVPGGEYLCPETALVEIACSACWRHFEVVFSIPGTGLQETIGKCGSLAEAIQKGEIHYGDPPNDGNCRDGASMGCYNLRVLQYWSRANEKHSWLRDSRLEIELPDARELRRLEVERIVANFPDIRGRQQISLIFGETYVGEKVCIFGAHGVGKRRLASGFQPDMYSDRYRATIGVQICKKVFVVGNASVTMAIWNVADLDTSDAMLVNYSRGMSGYFLVADGTDLRRWNARERFTSGSARLRSLHRALRKQRAPNRRRTSLMSNSRIERFRSFFC